MRKTIQWQKGDKFVVTGRRIGGKRFKFTTESPWGAFSTNLYNGSVWLLRNGKRTLLQRVSMTFVTNKVDFQQ